MPKEKEKSEVFKMNKMYIGSFTWENGSINDNIRKILRDLQIGCYNTFNGDVITISGNHKVKAEQVENDNYNVCVLF